MLKKSLVLGMTVALAASTIVGCGSTANEDANQGGTNQEASKTEADPKELTVGFIPSQNAEELSAKAKPMGDLLSKELGIPVKVSVTTNFNALVEAMTAKKMDVGFLNPVNYVFAHDKRKSVTILLQTVRNGSDSYRAQWVKKKGDESLKDVKDMKGKKVAFVDGASAAGYTYPRLMMMNAGLNPDTDVKGIMAGGHDKALMALIRGDVDAAATFEDARTVISKEVPDVMDKLDVFAYSEPIPNDTVSIRNGFSEAFNKKVQDAFIKIMSTEEGKKIGKEIYSFDGLVPGKDENFNNVRQAIEKLGLSPQ